ncbi:MAG: MBL fold metallo-hydrolase [Erysipelotrichaceae bacterium]|nr:MBL fold metallo-hydrolase [Erysipelotrichaceae bacterium]
MHYVIVGSGSKGNATILFSHGTTILIDLGLPLIRVKEGLQLLNKTIKDVDGVIYTHEHSDHINGLKSFSPKIMYATEGTLPGSLSNRVEYYQPFTIKNLKITPFPTSHDAKKPCGYVIESEDEKFVYFTDSGVFVEAALPLLVNPDYLMIESNHDVARLMHTNRPMNLKMRILSDHGHLCNEDSAFAASKIVGNKTKEVILAHLSEEANTPELALEAYRNVFSYCGLIFDRYHIRCAPQWNCMEGGNLDEN